MKSWCRGRKIGPLYFVDMRDMYGARRIGVWWRGLRFFGYTKEAAWLIARRKESRK